MLSAREGMLAEKWEALPDGDDVVTCTYASTLKWDTNYCMLCMYVCTYVKS